MSIMFDVDTNYSVYFSMKDPVSGKIVEAGSVMFHYLDHAMKFMDGVMEHPGCEAKIFYGAKTTYQSGDDSLI